MDGTTNAIIQKLMENAAAKGHFCEFYILNRFELHGCQACRYCRTEGDRCGIDDKISQILDKIYDADMLIVGSPVYMGDVTGQLKIFMDRLYSMKDSSGKPRLSDKKGILVFSQGASGKEYYKDMFSRVKKTFDGYNIKIQNMIVNDSADISQDSELQSEIESVCADL